MTPTPVRPIQHISSDIVGPLPRTSRNNVYILGIHCLFSGWIELFALEDQTALTVAKVLAEQYITRWGLFETFLSDNGTNYTSELLKEFCKLLKIKKVTVGSYRPEANGLAERSHRVLEEYLRHYCSADFEWDEALSYARIAMNSCPSTVSKFSPFFLMFNREFIPPKTLVQPPEQSYSEDDYVQQFKDRMRAAYEVARKNIIKRKQANLEYANKNRSLPDFAIGDVVLLYDPTLRKSRSKIEASWIGPYKVTEKLSEVTYVIKKNRKLLKVHANRLKAFRDR